MLKICVEDINQVKNRWFAHSDLNFVQRSVAEFMFKLVSHMKLCFSFLFIITIVFIII